MKVKEIMSQDPAYCVPNTSLHDVARLMVKHDCGAIPVVDDEQHKTPLGIVTDRDITCRAVAEGRNPLELTAADCMTSPPASVNPEVALEDCCTTMQAKQVRRMLVVNDDQECCGIIAQADIAEFAPTRDTAAVVQEVSR